ncbi:hypothetical protein ACFLTL_00730, partial [Chloroflexota bacterium]
MTTPTSGGIAVTIPFTAVGNPGDSTPINGNFIVLADPEGGDDTTGTVSCDPDNVDITVTPTP